MKNIINFSKYFYYYIFLNNKTINTLTYFIIIIYHLLFHTYRILLPKIDLKYYQKCLIIIFLSD